MAAMSLSHSDSALGAFYRRLCGRMDKPRANTATAHKLARMVYFMLTRGEAFVDQGQQRYEEQQRQRSIAALKRRAAALGFQHQPRGGSRMKPAAFSFCFLRRRWALPGLRFSRNVRCGRLCIAATSLRLPQPQPAMGGAVSCSCSGLPALSPARAPLCPS